jgi:aryl-alcohol dehydrogenase-like predicted oxidoreductase
METRRIPSSGEPLPVVGLGTWQKFDVTPGSEPYARLPAVLDTLFAGGGTLIDTSPMYARAERTVGELLRHRPGQPRPFLATKVWTRGRDAGIRQMNESFRLLRTEVIDLLQVHNLVDWQVHLQTLRAWKAEGRVRYIGITHYTPSAHASVESALRDEPVDFLQIDYSLQDTAAERRLLPVAQDLGVAVIANVPFGAGHLLPRLAPLPLPKWAAEIDARSWAELALKFVLSHPAITCAIPGTGSPASMAQNVRAGSGPMLTTTQRRELLALFG